MANMVNGSSIWNNFNSVFLSADFSSTSDLKLQASSSPSDALGFTFSPASAGEFNICTTNADDQPYCLEVWNLRDTVVHLGPPSNNNNGSQLWMVDMVMGGYKLSNFNSGPLMYLDVNTTSKEVIFSKGQWVGQVWSNREVINNTASIMPSQTPTPSPMMSDPPSSSDPFPSSDPSSGTMNAPTLQSSAAAAATAKHNPAAIIGVAVGCSMVPLLFATLVITLFLRRRKAKKALDEVDFVPMGGSGTWSHLTESSTSAKAFEK